MADSLPYTHLYTDDAGVTHFTDAALPWQSSPRGTPPMPRWTTAFQDAHSVGYVRAGAGYVFGLAPGAAQAICYCPGRDDGGRSGRRRNTGLYPGHDSPRDRPHGAWASNACGWG